VRRVLGLLLVLVPGQALAQARPELLAPATPTPTPTPTSTSTSTEAPPPPAPTTRAHLLLTTGVDYRRIYDIGMTLGHLAVGLAVEQPTTRRAGFFGVEIMGGATEYGLAVVDYRLGGGLEWRFGRFRPGFGADVGWLTIARATTSDSAKTLWLGIYGQATLDLVDFGAGEALYLGARLGFDLLGAPPSPLVWGPSADVGVRF